MGEAGYTREGHDEANLLNAELDRMVKEYGPDSEQVARFKRENLETGEKETPETPRPGSSTEEIGVKPEQTETETDPYTAMLAELSALDLSDYQREKYLGAVRMLLQHEDGAVEAVLHACVAVADDPERLKEALGRGIAEISERIRARMPQAPGIKDAFIRFMPGEAAGPRGEKPRWQAQYDLAEEFVQKYVRAEIEIGLRLKTSRR